MEIKMSKTQNGWIKISRNITDHWLFNDDKYFSAWIKILLKVSDKDDCEIFIKHKLLICNRGEALLSIDGWVKYFGKGWSVRQVRTFFSLLESDGVISIYNEKITTRLIVCNYGDYQDEK